MRRLALSALGALVILGALAASAEAFELRATVRDSGKTVHLYRGDVLQVTLSENPSTGYAWRIVKRSARAVLRPLSDRFIPPRQTNPPTVGTPGRHVYRWRASGRGRTSLRLQLFPPGANARPAQTFRLAIVVH